MTIERKIVVSAIIILIVGAIIIYFMPPFESKDTTETEDIKKARTETKNLETALTHTNSKLIDGVKARKENIKSINKNISKKYEAATKQFNDIPIYTDLQRDSILSTYYPQDSFKLLTDYGFKQGTEGRLD